MRVARSAVGSVAAVFGALAAAGAAVGGQGFELGMEIAAARAAAPERCASWREVEVEPPVFPLAARRELHLLCSGWQTPGGRVERTALVFADGVLVAIEARGGAVAALAGPGRERHGDYLHLRVFDDWRRLADPKADAVWILSEGATHLNLFTWANPLLTDGVEALPAYRRSAAVPVLLDFAVPLDEQLPRYEAECPLLEVSRDERVWLPNEPRNQTQVNCFGYEYAGFPRKLEAVYGDGRLHVVWILTGRGEEERLRRALVAAFGAPTSADEKWVTFAGGRAGLRKDKPEVLLLSAEIAPLYREELGLEPRR